MNSSEQTQAPSRRSRIGVLTPSSNTVLEPVMTAMTSGLPTVTLHFSRFRVTEIALTDRSLGQFDTGAMLASAELLAHARVAAIVWGGTSGGWLGLDVDRALCRLVEDRFAVPATTVTLALVGLARAAGIERIAFVTPYTEDVQAGIERTFVAEGFSCVRVAPLGISDNFAFSDVASEALDRMVAEAAAARPDVIVPYCTNMSAARHAERWEAEHGIPVFDSNAVAVRSALDLVAYSGGAVRGWGSLLEAEASGPYFAATVV